MDQFRVFRAIGLAFKAWFANFIPITLLAVVLYSPMIIWLTQMPSFKLETLGDADQFSKAINHGVWLQQALATLIAPFTVYRVIQYMNGEKTSIVTSVKYGVRGILPAAILGGAVTLINMIPMGGIIGAILLCYWFVAAPAAVVEKLNPVAALSRSATLTSGRRWPIFGLCFLVGLIEVLIMVALLIPAITSKNLESIKSIMITIFVVGGVSQLFMGIVAAVSYSLLRGDKDGVTNEELAKVFE